MVPSDTIRRMTDRIVERFRPEKVIVFGSCARGTATADSDVDFLVVMPLRDGRLKTCVEIRKVLRGFGVPKDIMVVTSEEFEAYKDCPGSIVYPAAHEGRAVYAA